MRILNVDEAYGWAVGWTDFEEGRRLPTLPSRLPYYAKAPLHDADIALCRQIESALHPWRACLLWVTEWAIWPSSANWHLFYRLRRTYGEIRLIEEAPVHVFLDYESADLATFIQVGILHGWDFHLIPVEGYCRAFISHDEYIEFASASGNQHLVEEFASLFGGAEIIGSPSA